eukprot:gene11483-biopygen8335
MQKIMIFGAGVQAVEQPRVNVTVDTSGINAAFAKQLEYQRHPWAQQQDQCQHSYDRLQEEARKEGVVERLKKEVEEKAKSGELAPMEVMCLQYLLFYDDKPDEARTMLSLIFLRTTLANRFQLHNWGAIARQMLPADVTQYGGIMKDLPFPLFPPEVCRLTNEKVFSAYSAPLYGGAAQKDPRTRLEKLYRNPREEQHVLRGGAMDPVYDGSGRQTAAIDSSEVKTMIASMQRAVRASLTVDGGKGKAAARVLPGRPEWKRQGFQRTSSPRQRTALWG